MLSCKGKVQPSFHFISFSRDKRVMEVGLHHKDKYQNHCLELHSNTVVFYYSVNFFKRDLFHVQAGRMIKFCLTGRVNENLFGFYLNSAQNTQ